MRKRTLPDRKASAGAASQATSLPARTHGDAKTSIMASRATESAVAREATEGALARGANGDAVARRTDETASAQGAGEAALVPRPKGVRMATTTQHDAPRYIEDAHEPVDRFAVSVGRALVNGGEFPYSFLRIKPGVCVLPVIEAGGGLETVLIRQYRFAVGSWQTELPAGAIDPGEEPPAAAARELAEETGYQARELVDLGPHHPSPGATDETIHLYLARCEAHEGATNLDPSEDIRHARVPLAELARLIANGEFSHGAGQIGRAHV